MARSFAGLVRLAFSLTLWCAPGAEFMHKGHHLRHLRRMKRLYRARQDLLLTALENGGQPRVVSPLATGLAVLLRLPHGANDVRIATQALQFGLAPVALSPWVRATEARAGLLLYLTNVSSKRLAADCVRLDDLITRFDDRFHHASL